MHKSRTPPALSARKPLFEVMRLIAASRRIPDWIWRDVAIPFVATRAMLVLVAWLGFHLVHHEVVFSGAFEFSGNGERRSVTGFVSPDLPFINMWSRWDADWYLKIAKEGYSYEPGASSTTAFFPLYPLTIRVVHRALFLPSHDAGWAFSGILVSNAALLAALIYLVRLVRLDFDQATARRAALYLCVFPSTLFLSAVYTESLFLLTIIAAFYYGRRGRWFVASLIGAASALCRPPGFLLCIALAFEYLAQRKFNWRAIRAGPLRVRRSAGCFNQLGRPAPSSSIDTSTTLQGLKELPATGGFGDILWLALIPLALLGHLYFLRTKFGAWDILQTSQEAWNRGFTLLPYTLRNVIMSAHPIEPLDIPAIDLAFFLFFLAATIFGAFRLRLSYTVYAFLSVIFLSSWTTLHSLSRLGLMIFPAFIALAAVGRNENLERAFVVICIGLAALFMLMFSQWAWVA